MKKKAIIAAGGSGGHIYPALAIAKAFEKSHEDFEVHFVGTPDGMEADLIPRESFPFHTIPIGRLNRNARLSERVKTILLMPWAFIKSVLLVLKLRPAWVLGVGGFASGPVIFVAALFRVKSFIWEPNAFPGLANRLLSRFVGTGILIFKDALKHLKLKKWFRVGYPLRAEFENLAGQDPSESGSPLKILIFGGSQGARGINNIAVELFLNPQWVEKVQVVHQIGKHDFEVVEKKYSEGQVSFVERHAFLYDMKKRLDWADLVICRCGMATLSELAAVGKPSILVPLPWAADDHQKKNAQVLVEKGAAVMIEQKELTVESLGRVLSEFIEHREKLVEMGHAVHELYEPHATERIVHILSGREGEGLEVSSI